MESCDNTLTKDSLLVTIFSDDEGLPDDAIWSGLGNLGTAPEIIEIQSTEASNALLIEGQNLLGHREKPKRYGGIRMVVFIGQFWQCSLGSDGWRRLCVVPSTRTRSFSREC